MTTMRWNHFVCPHYHTSGECGTDRLSTPSVTNLGYRPKAIQHQKSIRGARNSNWLEKYMGCRPVNRDDAEAKQRYRSDRMARQQINPRCSSGTVASVRAVVQKHRSELPIHLQSRFSNSILRQVGKVNMRPWPSTGMKGQSYWFGACTRTFFKSRPGHQVRILSAQRPA